MRFTPSRIAGWKVHHLPLLPVFCSPILPGPVPERCIGPVNGASSIATRGDSFRPNGLIFISKSQPAAQNIGKQMVRVVISVIAMNGNQYVKLIVFLHKFRRHQGLQATVTHLSDFYLFTVFWKYSNRGSWWSPFANQPNVGKYTIHGWYGLGMISNQVVCNSRQETAPITAAFINCFLVFAWGLSFSSLSQHNETWSNVLKLNPYTSLRYMTSQYHQVSPAYDSWSHSNIIKKSYKNHI